MFARHLWARNGTMGDAIPDDNSEFFLHPNGDNQNKLGSFVYFPAPSGSLTTSDNQLFNKPYWLRRAQGTNNGICWGNDLFVTVYDNTRGTNFTISVLKENKTLNTSYQYTASDFKQYHRHVEEYELEFVFQLCKVQLNADILAHINVMNPRVLEDWNLAFVPPAPQGIEDAYRYLKSAATRCPPEETPEEAQDPYKDLNFWIVDLREKFSSDLTQYPLGRKFMYQLGYLNGKRVRTDYTVKPKKSVKRKRSK